MPNPSPGFSLALETTLSRKGRRFGEGFAYATMTFSAGVALRSSWESGAGRPNR